MTDILSRLAALTAKDANGCLPCPFCTNAPEIHRYESHFASFGTSFQIECSHEDCPVEASSAALPSAEEAIEDWNHNHSGSKVIALVQEARKEIERLRKALKPFDAVYSLVKRNPEYDYERNFATWMYAGDSDGLQGFRCTGSLHGFDVYEEAHKALNPKEGAA